MKCRKVVGMDGLNTKMFKCLGYSKQMTEEMIKRGKIETENIPERWKNSLTTMIPKVSKP